MKKAALTLLILLPILLMAQSDNQVTEDFLQSFADAFNAHDVKDIMSHMTDDCVFEASAGPDFDGEKFTGQENVGKAFEDVFTTFPDAHWGSARHFVLGDRGFSEWIFTGTKVDGTRVEVTGCDLFTFRDGKIAIKNSYRKNRMPTK
jgi:ketosteroid isomerase-like protein